MLATLNGNSSFSPDCTRCVACNSTERVSIHYNALSCHGCKAFFRRTVFERRKYYCSSEGRCDITDENRNQCRACRFQKCIKGGMNPKHVREERAKRRPNGDSEHEYESPSKIVIVEEHAITKQLVQLEYASERGERRGGEDSDGLRRQVIEEYSVPSIDLTTMNYSCDRIMIDDELTDSYFRAFLILSEWAGDIAEFRLLSSADQMLLFRQNFMIFGWLHFVYRSVRLGVHVQGVPLGNGAYIPYREEEQARLAPKWRSTYGIVCTKLIEMVAMPMAELDIDTEEYVLIKAMSLFQADNQLSVDGQRVTKQMRDVLLNALIAHIERRFPMLTSMQRSERCVKLTLLFPALMAILDEMVRGLEMTPPLHIPSTTPSQIGHLEATYVQKMSREVLASSTSPPLLPPPSTTPLNAPIQQAFNNVNLFCDTMHLQYPTLQ